MDKITERVAKIKENKKKLGSLLKQKISNLFFCA
jgi:hypothetical protein